MTGKQIKALPVVVGHHLSQRKSTEMSFFAGGDRVLFLAAGPKSNSVAPAGGRTGADVNTIPGLHLPQRAPKRPPTSTNKKHKAAPTSFSTSYASASACSYFNTKHFAPPSGMSAEAQSKLQRIFDDELPAGASSASPKAGSLWSFAGAPGSKFSSAAASVVSSCCSSSSSSVGSGLPKKALSAAQAEKLRRIWDDDLPAGATASGVGRGPTAPAPAAGGGTSMSSFAPAGGERGSGFTTSFAAAGGGMKSTVAAAAFTPAAPGSGGSFSGSRPGGSAAASSVGSFVNAGTPFVFVRPGQAEREGAPQPQISCAPPTPTAAKIVKTELGPEAAAKLSRIFDDDDDDFSVLGAQTGAPGPGSGGRTSATGPVPLHAPLNANILPSFTRAGVGGQLHSAPPSSVGLNSMTSTAAKNLSRAAQDKLARIFDDSDDDAGSGVGKAPQLGFSSISCAPASTLRKPQIPLIKDRKNQHSTSTSATTGATGGAAGASTSATGPAPPRQISLKRTTNPGSFSSSITTTFDKTMTIKSEGVGAASDAGGGPPTKKRFVPLKRGDLVVVNAEQQVEASSKMSSTTADSMSVEKETSGMLSNASVASRTTTTTSREEIIDEEIAKVKKKLLAVCEKFCAKGKVEREFNKFMKEIERAVANGSPEMTAPAPAPPPPDDRFQNVNAREFQQEQDMRSSRRQQWNLFRTFFMRLVAKIAKRDEVQGLNAEVLTKTGRTCERRKEIAQAKVSRALLHPLSRFAADGNWFELQKFLRKNDFRSRVLESNDVLLHNKLLDRLFDEESESRAKPRSVLRRLYEEANNFSVMPGPLSVLDEMKPSDQQQPKKSTKVPVKRHLLADDAGSFHLTVQLLAIETDPIVDCSSSESESDSDDENDGGDSDNDSISCSRSAISFPSPAPSSIASSRVAAFTAAVRSGFVTGNVVPPPTVPTLQFGDGGFGGATFGSNPLGGFSSLLPSSGVVTRVGDQAALFAAQAEVKELQAFHEKNHGGGTAKRTKKRSKRGPEQMNNMRVKRIKKQKPAVHLHKQRHASKCRVGLERRGHEGLALVVTDGFYVFRVHCAGDGRGGSGAGPRELEKELFAKIDEAAAANGRTEDATGGGGEGVQSCVCLQVQNVRLIGQPADNWWEDLCCTAGKSSSTAASTSTPTDPLRIEIQWNSCRAVVVKKESVAAASGPKLVLAIPRPKIGLAPAQMAFPLQHSRSGGGNVPSVDVLVIRVVASSRSGKSHHGNFNNDVFSTALRLPAPRGEQEQGSTAVASCSTSSSTSNDAPSDSVSATTDPATMQALQKDLPRPASGNRHRGAGKKRSVGAGRTLSKTTSVHFLSRKPGACTTGGRVGISSFTRKAESSTTSTARVHNALREAKTNFALTRRHFPPPSAQRSEQAGSITTSTAPTAAPTRADKDESPDAINDEQLILTVLDCAKDQTDELQFAKIVLNQSAEGQNLSDFEDKFLGCRFFVTNLKRYGGAQMPFLYLTRDSAMRDITKQSGCEKLVGENAETRTQLEIVMNALGSSCGRGGEAETTSNCATSRLRRKLAALMSTTSSQDSTNATESGVRAEQLHRAPSFPFVSYMDTFVKHLYYDFAAVLLGVKRDDDVLHCFLVSKMGPPATNRRSRVASQSPASQFSFLNLPQASCAGGGGGDACDSGRARTSGERVPPGPISQLMQQEQQQQRPQLQFGQSCGAFPSSGNPPPAFPPQQRSQFATVAFSGQTQKFGGCRPQQTQFGFQHQHLQRLSKQQQFGFHQPHQQSQFGFQPAHRQSQFGFQPQQSQFGFQPQQSQLGFHSQQTHFAGFFHETQQDSQFGFDANQPQFGFRSQQEPRFGFQPQQSQFGAIPMHAQPTSQFGSFTAQGQAPTHFGCPPQQTQFSKATGAAAHSNSSSTWPAQEVPAGPAVAPPATVVTDASPPCVLADSMSTANDKQGANNATRAIENGDKDHYVLIRVSIPILATPSTTMEQTEEGTDATRKEKRGQSEDEKTKKTLEHDLRKLVLVQHAHGRAFWWKNVKFDFYDGVMRVFNFRVVEAELRIGTTATWSSFEFEREKVKDAQQFLYDKHILEREDLS